MTQREETVGSNAERVYGHCEVVAQAWDLLNGLKHQLVGMPVGVTDPIAGAIRELSNAQDALEHQLGHWTRIERSAAR